MEPASTTTPASAGSRDELIDIVRSGALGVVVLYHWCFTIVWWKDDGPHASNPIGTTRGLWLLTWVLQVMPLFFVVGGAVHVLARDRGLPFVTRRLKALLPPGLAVAGAVFAVAWIADASGTSWSFRAAVLVVSPLWFLVVYSALIVMVPLARWAHDRWGEVVPVFLAVCAGLTDVARFHFKWVWAPWLAWIVVFGFCHQVGFSWERLRAAPPRFGSCLVIGGLGGLVALTNMGLYPRSAVGVPGEPISNMGPPTLVIVALCCFQLGLLIRYAPLVLRAAHTWAARPVAFLRRWGMVVYLGHGIVMALVYGLLTVTVGRPPEESNGAWWLTRPLWVLLPSLVFAGILWSLARIGRRRPVDPAPRVEV